MLLGAGVAQALAEDQQIAESPCPSMPVQVRAEAIQLSPGLTEHESWVDFRVPMQFAGTYALCVNDREMESGGGKLDFHTGFARFHIQTRQVNLHWATHSLDELDDPTSGN